MSVIKETLVFCDGEGCDALFGSSDCRNETAAQQRAGFAQEGWHRAGDKDYCPECWAKRKKAKGGVSAKEWGAWQP